MIDGRSVIYVYNIVMYIKHSLFRFEYYVL